MLRKSNSVRRVDIAFSSKNVVAMKLAILDKACKELNFNKNSFVDTTITDLVKIDSTGIIKDEIAFSSTIKLFNNENQYIVLYCYNNSSPVLQLEPITKERIPNINSINAFSLYTYKSTLNSFATFLQDNNDISHMSETGMIVDENHEISMNYCTENQLKGIYYVKDDNGITKFTNSSDLKPGKYCAILFFRGNDSTKDDAQYEYFMIKDNVH